MTTLNRDAALAARDAGAHALTDVTGFGLLGHLHELAEASGLAAELDAAAGPGDRRRARAARPIPRSGRSRAARAATASTRPPSRPSPPDVPEARRWLAVRRDDLRRAAGRGGARAGRRGARAGDRPPGRRDAPGSIGVALSGSAPGGARERQPDDAAPARTPTPPAPSSPRGRRAASAASTPAKTAAPIRSPSISRPARRSSTSGSAQAVSSASAAPLAPTDDRDRVRPRP